MKLAAAGRRDHERSGPKNDFEGGAGVGGQRWGGTLEQSCRQFQGGGGGYRRWIYHHAGRLRIVRYSRKFDRGAGGPRVTGLHTITNNLGRGRVRHGTHVGGGYDCLARWQLRRREQTTGANGDCGKADKSPDSTRNAGGTHSRWRRGHTAFYTPAGVGTLVAEGKETREFEGKTYLMERWLKADFALVKAWSGDRHGKSGLPEDRAQFQSHDGDRGADHHRRSGRTRGTGRAGARHVIDARHLCETDRPGRALRAAD